MHLREKKNRYYLLYMIENKIYELFQSKMINKLLSYSGVDFFKLSFTFTQFRKNSL